MPDDRIPFTDLISNDTVKLTPRQWSSVFEALRWYAPKKPVDAETKKPVDLNAIATDMLVQLGVVDSNQQIFLVEGKA